jgi:hypothetical protein
VAAPAQAGRALGDNRPSAFFWGCGLSIKSQKDFASGVMFTVTGAAFAWNAATSYNIGTAAQMGAGYFPLVLSSVLVLLGGFILFFSLVVETPDGGLIGEFAWRPLFAVVGANLSFGVLLGGLPFLACPSAGLVVAIYVLCGLALLADPGAFTVRRWLVLSSVLAAASYLLFIQLLKFTLPVWPEFILAY